MCLSAVRDKCRSCLTCRRCPWRGGDSKGSSDVSREASLGVAVLREGTGYADDRGLEVGLTWPVGWRRWWAVRSAPECPPKETSPEPPVDAVQHLAVVRP